MDKFEQYQKLKKLKEIAEKLDYTSVLDIIKADDEIEELYYELKQDGFTDREIREG